MSHSELVSALEAAFAASETGTDASHDINHARRVMRSALGIARNEGSADEQVIVAAAYLHDLVNLPKNHPERSGASARSAEGARPILERLDFSAAQIEAVQHAIVTHSFSANLEPFTLEAKAIQDADRLEAIGAIGIARVFAIAGQMGSSLFDGEDPFARRRPPDDKRFAVDHFAIKLFKLPATMQTRTGREIAERRTQFMRDYLDQLAHELGDDDPRMNCNC